MKLAVVLVAVTLAGCASSGTAGSPPTSGSPTPTTSSTAPVTSPEELARVEAMHLLRLAVLPPGSKRVTPTAAQRHDSPGTIPGVTSLVREQRFYRVPRTLDGAGAWLAAHRPEGLSDGATMSSSGPGGARTVARSWEAAPTQTWSQAELQVGVQADGAATLWGVTGQVVWLDSKPAPDDATGPRLRVTVDGGCPDSTRGDVGVTNSGADLETTLVPADSPTGGLICRYDGLNAAPPQGLAGSSRLDATQAAALARALQARPLSHADGEIRHCPMDDGEVTIDVLSYRGRADVDIWQTTSGCRSAANGFVVAG